jgi:hypothetical protein
MSGKSSAAVSHKAQAAASAHARTVVHNTAANRSDASARWAALDSRHERLVTAADAVLADLDRKDDRRMAC